MSEIEFILSEINKEKIINKMSDIEFILSEIGKQFHIKEHVTRSVYKIVDAVGSPFILKIIDSSETPWFTLAPHLDLIERYMGNYRLCDRLGLGPKIFQTNRFGSYASIIMEYLPFRLTQSFIDSNKDNIRNFVQTLHSQGLYHGDLHAGNIMMDFNGKFKIVDLETMFYADEININNNISYNPLILEWIKGSYDDIETLQEYIDMELNKLWLYEIDD